jgi:hypothetical protein
MKIVIRLVLLLAVAALGFWLWTIFFPGPEKVIRGKMASLATTATFGSADSNLNRAAKAANVVGYFSDDAQISLDALGHGTRSLSGRDEIREASYGGFAALTALKVEFLDVTVRLGTDKQTADVSCTARVYVGKSKDYGVQEMRFQFKRVDKTWLISRVETVKTLS